MPSKWRRFEVLIPLHWNDGQEIPVSSENTKLARMASSMRSILIIESV